MVQEPIKIPKELIYYGLTTGNDPNWVSEELMLAQLLIDDVVHINDVHWCFDFYEAYEHIETEKYTGPNYRLKAGVDPKKDTVCCFVNINDIFCYGGDAIPIRTNELRALYEYHMDFEGKYKGFGVAIWASLKQGIKPFTHGYIEAMKQVGVWHYVENLI